MLDRDRKLFLVAGVAAVIGIVFGFFLGRVEVRGTQAGTTTGLHPSQIVGESVFNLLPPWPAPGDPAGNETTYSKDEDTKQRGLAAQEWAAWSAFWTLFISIVGVFLVWRTLRAALQANSGFAVSASREQRAYVFIDKSIVDENGGQRRINLRVKNGGKTPAHNCMLLYTIDIQPRPPGTKDPDVPIPNILPDLAPNASKEMTIGFSAEWLDERIIQDSEEQNLILTGQISYTDLDNVRRFSELSFVAPIKNRNVTLGNLRISQTGNTIS